MKTPTQKHKKVIQHETWCAKVIAYNAQVPFNVRCDCQKKPPSKATMIPIKPPIIAKLTGIYNEPPTWKEVFGTVIVLGIPFALLVAFILNL